MKDVESVVVWVLHREVLLLNGCAYGWGRWRGSSFFFWVIASQHPIVSGLSGGSNLGAEVVLLCTLTDQTIVICSGAGGSAAHSRWVFIEETGASLDK